MWKTRCVRTFKNFYYHSTAPFPVSSHPLRVTLLRVGV